MSKLHLKRYFSVKRVVLCLAAVLFLAGLFFVIRDEVRQTHDNLLQSASVYQTFTYQDETYTLSSAYPGYSLGSNKVHYLLRTAENEEDFVSFPAYTLWCEESGRLVYADGKKLYTCDVDGKNRETLFKLSGISPRLSVRLNGPIDGFAVVCAQAALRGGAAEPLGLYYIIDLVSGEITETDVPASTTVLYPIEISDGWLYYSKGFLSRKDDAIYRCNLETGISEVYQSATDTEGE